ncbi:MAG TPA: DUF1460 domain-containing protein [Bacteroidales bacterium]|jgi:TusA-related sulfurtransferase|nr:DUF1460 domain-containing protein [Bacteroidales bacterium]
MNRKQFVHPIVTGLLSLLFVLSLSCKAKNTAVAFISGEDKAILSAFFHQAREQRLTEMSSGQRIIAIASYFMGSPYITGSLEAPGEERLQVNLRAFDCLTLVETVLALNETIVLTSDPDSCLFIYPSVLQNIRYRNGRIQGYTSRLHYTSEWLLNGQEKGLFSLLTDLFPGEAFPLELNYMSAHPQHYPALKDNPALTEEMATIEARLNKASLSYIPKTQLAKYMEDIPQGSIIAITTDRPGLDIAHIGFACRQNGRLYLLHASSSNSRVEISEQSLLTYLNSVKHFSGIMIAQVNK